MASLENLPLDLDVQPLTSRRKRKRSISYDNIKYLKEKKYDTQSKPKQPKNQDTMNINAAISALTALRKKPMTIKSKNQAILNMEIAISALSALSALSDEKKSRNHDILHIEAAISALSALSDVDIQNIKVLLMAYYKKMFV